MNYTGTSVHGVGNSLCLHAWYSHASSMTSFDPRTILAEDEHSGVIPTRAHILLHQAQKFEYRERKFGEHQFCIENDEFLEILDACIKIERSISRTVGARQPEVFELRQGPCAPHFRSVVISQSRCESGKGSCSCPS